MFDGRAGGHRTVRGSVVTFLSEAWLAELDAALRATSPPAEVDLRVRQVVDDVAYTVVVTGGRARLGDEPGDVTFTADRATAEALARGALAAQDAFLAGRLRLGGDVAALLRHGPAMATLESALARVRERTTWN